MKTHRVVLTGSPLFFHEDQKFPQTFAEYAKKEEQKDSNVPFQGRYMPTPSAVANAYEIKTTDLGKKLTLSGV